MTRRLISNIVMVCLLAAAVGLSVYSVKAGPMSAAKDSARESAEDAGDHQVAQADALETQAHDAARKQMDVGDDDDDTTGGAQIEVDAQGKPMPPATQESPQAGGAMADETMSEMEHRMLVKKAVVDLHPTEGNQAHGTVTLTQQEDSVLIEATVMGLTPNSTHAIHVHQYGDVTSPDGTAAGSHYDPRGHPHALADTVEGHAGDFGNLEADASGTANFSFTAQGISIAGMNNPVLGRAIIVHAQPDDGGQPTGNAGARIAQGVIGIAE